MRVVVTYKERHGNGRWKCPQDHDPPVFPAIGVIAKVDDPGCHTRLERRHFSDVGTLPGPVSRGLEDVIGTLDNQVAQTAISMMKVPITHGLSAHTAGEVSMSEDSQVLVDPCWLLKEVDKGPSKRGGRSKDMGPRFEGDREDLFVP